MDLGLECKNNNTAFLVLTVSVITASVSWPHAQLVTCSSQVLDYPVSLTIGKLVLLIDSVSLTELSTQSWQLCAGSCTLGQTFELKNTQSMTEEDSSVETVHKVKYIQEKGSGLQKKKKANKNVVLLPPCVIFSDTFVQADDSLPLLLILSVSLLLSSQIPILCPTEDVAFVKKKKHQQEKMKRQNSILSPEVNLLLHKAEGLYCNLKTEEIAPAKSK